MNVDHDIALPALVRSGAVDPLQLPNVLGKFLREIHPAAALYVSLPFADVFVSVLIVLDMLHHPIWIQSRCIDHTVQAVSNFAVTLFKNVSSLVKQSCVALTVSISCDTFSILQPSLVLLLHGGTSHQAVLIKQPPAQEVFQLGDVGRQLLLGKGNMSVNIFIHVSDLSRSWSKVFAKRSADEVIAGAGDLLESRSEGSPSLVAVFEPFVILPVFDGLFDLEELYPSRVAEFL